MRLKTNKRTTIDDLIKWACGGKKRKVERLTNPEWPITIAEGIRIAERITGFEFEHISTWDEFDESVTLTADMGEKGQITLTENEIKLLRDLTDHYVRMTESYKD